MKNFILKYIPWAVLCLVPLALVHAADKTAQNPVKFEPTVDSLKQAGDP